MSIHPFQGNDTTDKNTLVQGWFSSCFRFIRFELWTCSIYWPIFLQFEENSFDLFYHLRHNSPFQIDFSRAINFLKKLTQRVNNGPYETRLYSSWNLWKHFILEYSQHFKEFYLIINPIQNKILLIPWNQLIFLMKPISNHFVFLAR